MLTGHEEYSSNSQLASFKTYIELENYELKDLNLLVEEKVPDDCKTLIISSPKKDFTDVETEKIKNYINAGGNILWMNDTFTSNEQLNNIQSLLDLYGVKIHQDGIMVEQNASKIVMQSPDMILPQIMPSEITSKIASKGAVLFIDTSKLSFVDNDKFEELGVSKTDLLTTSEESFFRKDLSIPNLTATEHDEKGSQIIGASLEKKINDDTNSKLVVYANNIFASDAPVTIASQTIPAVRLYNNMDLILNSVEYLADAEDQITIRKNIDIVNYTSTETQKRVVMAIIFSVPVIIIIFGIVVWQLRRRKK